MTRADSRRQRTFRAIEALLRLSEGVERRRAQLAGQVGLSDGQWSVLEEIQREHFMPSLFARNREKSPAAVSRTLRQLSERGMIQARISPADGRQRDYAVTAKGACAISQLREAREAALAEVWDGFAAREVTEFARFAQQLAERIEVYAASVDSEG